MSVSFDGGVADVGIGVGAAVTISSSCFPGEISVPESRASLSAFHWPDLYVASETTRTVAKKSKNLRTPTMRERPFTGEGAGCASSDSGTGVYSVGGISSPPCAGDTDTVILQALRDLPSLLTSSPRDARDMPRRASARVLPRLLSQQPPAASTQPRGPATQRAIHTRSSRLVHLL